MTITLLFFCIHSIQWRKLVLKTLHQLKQHYDRCYYYRPNSLHCNNFGGHGRIFSLIIVPQSEPISRKLRIRGMSMGDKNLGEFAPEILPNGTKMCFVSHPVQCNLLATSCTDFDQFWNTWIDVPVHTVMINLKWPSVPDFLGQSWFLTTSCKKSQFSHFWLGVPDLSQHSQTVLFHCTNTYTSVAKN